MSSEDDLSWGIGAGCNGKVHILLEKVNKQMQENLLTLKNYLSDGISVKSVKLLRNDASFLQTYYVTENHQLFGCDLPNNYVVDLTAQNEKTQIENVESKKESIYMQQFHPEPRLFIFGAGPDVIPLSSIATKVGFIVHVWDWRPAYLEEFPEATLIAESNIQKAIMNIHFRTTDSVVIMTHDFQKDKEILKLLKKSHLNYIGILGPRHRTSRLLDNKAIPEHIHSPIGLSIKSEGPEEIAISIVAELILTRRKTLAEKRVSNEDDRNISRSG